MSIDERSDQPGAPMQHSTRSSRRRVTRPLATVVLQCPHPLSLLIESAARECPPGHAGALAELLTIALQKAPSRGIFEPGQRDESELSAQIESIAKKHLDLNATRAAYRKSLDDAGLEFAPRDRIATSGNDLRRVSDTAHYYAGLAFGLAFGFGYRTS
jgi:hypothetical protein